MVHYQRLFRVEARMQSGAPLLARQDLGNNANLSQAE
jgi:hypothetical protein